MFSNFKVSLKQNLCNFVTVCKTMHTRPCLELWSIVYRRNIFLFFTNHCFTDCPVDYSSHTAENYIITVWFVCSLLRKATKEMAFSDLSVVEPFQWFSLVCDVRYFTPFRPDHNTWSTILSSITNRTDSKNNSFKLKKSIECLSSNKESFIFRWAPLQLTTLVKWCTFNTL